MNKPDADVNPLLDVMGPLIEFMILPDETGGAFTVMQGTIPPGVSVPLHSHADVEGFFVTSGEVEVLMQRTDRLEWIKARSGEFIRVPGGSKHAFRNVSQEPCRQLITTTGKLGHFFQEIGRRIVPGEPLGPPTPEVLRHFLQVAAKYGYWLGSPEENAAIGISLF